MSRELILAEKWEQLANCARWNQEEAERERGNRKVDLKRADRLERQAEMLWEQSDAMVYFESAS